MAIVIPRARSSGALSMLSKLRYSASPLSASVFVIAAVSVVFPWSTCPIVPTLTCGFVRSNFAFAIPRPPLPLSASAARLPAHPGPRHQGLGDALRDFLVVGELHRVRRPPLGVGPHRG